MTNDEVRAFLSRFGTAWKEQDLVTLAESYNDDCEVVSPMFHTLRGFPQVEASFRDLFRAFSTESLRVDEVIIDSDTGVRAAVVWTAKVKHQGEIFGTPATGKSFEMTMALIITLVNGRIAREVRLYDFTRLLLQLGVLRARA
ncbi:MAG: ester cyclase [Vicinamibacterales bacterium]